jgi:hypothetical protein
MQLTIDSAIAQRLAEEGMARTLEVEGDAWIETALEALKRFMQIPGYHEFKTEDFRWWCASEGIAPHSHKVWGALTNTAQRRGLIEFARVEKSRSPKTHGHRVTVWRAVA